MLAFLKNKPRIRLFNNGCWMCFSEHSPIIGVGLSAADAYFDYCRWIQDGRLKGVDLES